MRAVCHPAETESTLLLGVVRSARELLVVYSYKRGPASTDGRPTEPLAPAYAVEDRLGATRERYGPRRGRGCRRPDRPRITLISLNTFLTPRINKPAFMWI
jgi:hypothetical protein